MRQAARVLPALAAVCVLASCATTISGSATAAPLPPKPPLSDPCELLTNEQASGLGLRPEPKFTEGDPDRIVPPSCSWQPLEYSGEADQLDVVLSLEFSFAEYADSAEVLEETEIGGLRWAKTEVPIMGDNGCALTTELGETSFVQVTTTDYGSDANPCESLDAAVPQVAGHLPGGLEAPPPVNPDAPPETPLTSVEPCRLLAPAELDGLALEHEGRASDIGDTPKEKILGCEWQGVRPDVSAVYLSVAPAISNEEMVKISEEVQVEQFDTGGRTWGVYKGIEPSMAATNCSVRLAYGPESSVAINSRHKTDPAKTCDAGKLVAEAVTPKLPPNS